MKISPTTSFVTELPESCSNASRSGLSSQVMGVDDDCPDTELGAGDDKTRAAAALSELPAADTVSALAYSEAAAADDDTDDAESGSAWRYALGGLLVLVTAGAFVVSAAVFMAQRDKHRAAPTPAAPAATSTTNSPSAEPSPAPTTPDAGDPARWNAPLEAVAQHLVPQPDPDQVYLAAMQNAGLIIYNPARAIASAHALCSYLADGHTKVEATRAAMTGETSLSAMDAARFVVIAVNIYCPQYR